MNKYLKITFYVLLLIALTVCTVACESGSGKEVDILSKYNFSADNIVEIGYAKGIKSDGGTVYGNMTVKCVKEGDGRIEELAKAWQTLQENAVFIDKHKNLDPMSTKSEAYYVCVFKDGSFVRLGYYGGNFLHNGGEYTIENKEVFDTFSAAIANALKDVEYNETPAFAE